jgi:hypothetical protein
MNLDQIKDLLRAVRVVIKKVKKKGTMRDIKKLILMPTLRLTGYMKP